MTAVAAPPRSLAWRRGFHRFRQGPAALAGLVLSLALCVVALLGPVLSPYPEQAAGAVDMAARFQPPSWHHVFGTNEVGQDVLTLVIMGARVSLFASVAIVLLGAAVGTLLGAVAGYVGRWIDDVLMRFADLKLTIPGLILAMAVAAALGASLLDTVIAIAVSWWPGYARLVRGEVVAKREELFVQAARIMGCSTWRILHRHILPNIMSPIVTKMALDMGFAILSVAALGFIGIGVRPPLPEWGTLLSVARNYMPDYWWIAVFPGAAIVLAVVGFHLVGDGLRDVLDPRGRR